MLSRRRLLAGSLAGVASLPYCGQSQGQTPSGWPPTLRDIVSRLPANSPAKEPDLITYAHEGNHFLSKWGENKRGIYVGQGRWWWLPIPPFKTVRVFDTVHEIYRHNAKSDTLWTTYRSQGDTAGWRDNPLMVVDEWRAYTVGSIVRQELGLDSRIETCYHAATFAHYTRVLLHLCSQAKGYEMKPILDFYEWNWKQCQTVRDFPADWKR